MNNNVVARLIALCFELEGAVAPSRDLDAKVEECMRLVEANRPGRDAGPSPGACPAYTASQDACVALVERMLPGWWWKVGTCCVSDDACVAPDFNSPVHGARLAAELMPIEPGCEFDAGFDVDRRPAGNVPIALLESLVRALVAVAETPPR